MAKSRQTNRRRTSVRAGVQRSAMSNSVMVLAGLRDVLTQVANGDPDGAIDTLEDMLDDGNIEDTLDGAEELSMLATLASDEDFDDEDFDEEADVDEDEDDEDYDEDEDEDDEGVVESSVRGTRRKVNHLNQAFASLDTLDDDEDEDFDEEADVDEDEEEYEDEDDEYVVESSVRSKRRQKAVASARRNVATKRLL